MRVGVRVGVRVRERGVVIMVVAGAVGVVGAVMVVVVVVVVMVMVMAVIMTVIVAVAMAVVMAVIVVVMMAAKHGRVFLHDRRGDVWSNDPPGSAEGRLHRRPRARVRRLARVSLTLSVCVSVSIGVCLSGDIDAGGIWVRVVGGTIPQGDVWMQVAGSRSRLRLRLRFGLRSRSRSRPSLVVDGCAPLRQQERGRRAIAIGHRPRVPAVCVVVGVVVGVTAVCVVVAVIGVTVAGRLCIPSATGQRVGIRRRHVYFMSVVCSVVVKHSRRLSFCLLAGSTFCLQCPRLTQSCSRWHSH